MAKKFKNVDIGNLMPGKSTGKIIRTLLNSNKVSEDKLTELRLILSNKGLQSPCNTCPDEIEYCSDCEFGLLLEQLEGKNERT